MLERRTFLTSAAAAAVAATLPKMAFGAALAPFKLFDTHAHFYTNDAEHYPFNAKGARYGPEKMIAKAMATPMTPEVIFKAWDSAGVAKGCGVQYNSTYATDNRYLLDISAKYPKRIVPVVICAPLDPATPALLAKLTKENRISGVRFTGPPSKEGDFPFISDAAAGAWEAANKLGLVIVLMPLGQAPKAMAQVAVMADKYPNVKIVLDHIGFPTPGNTPTFGFSPEHMALAKRKNVYYKYTTLLIEQLQEAKVPLRDFMKYAVNLYGANQMVWGSDIGNTEGQFIDFVHHALDSTEGLTLAQRKAIFYDTADRIFVPGGRGPAKA